MPVRFFFPFFQNDFFLILKITSNLLIEHQNGLGDKLRKILLEKEASLFPLFQYGVYYSDINQREIVRFNATAFFPGLNTRVEQLLNHVDNCIARHGEDTVLQ